MRAPCRPPPHLACGRRRGGPARLALVLLGLACFPPVARGGEGPEEVLQSARDLEAVHGEYAEALRIYERVILDEGRFGALAPEARARFLAGAARCHQAEGRPGRAAEYWARMIADESLPGPERQWAREQQAEHERQKASQAGEASAHEEFERLRERMREEARRQSRELEAQARELLRDRRFDDALALCFEAIAKDQDNQGARALREEIEAARPDRGEMLRLMIEFLQTTQLTDYQELKQRVLDMQRDGRLAFDRGDYAEADRIFRDGILRIDSSGFLSPGAPLDFESLQTDRTDLLTWLRQTIERGRAAGLDLLPEPKLPDRAARIGGLEAQFLDLLARMLPRRQQETPLRFYEMAPARLKDRPFRPPLFTARLTDGIQAQIGPGALSRARWAERWIRSTMGGPWADPKEFLGRRAPGARGAAPTPVGAHVLTRFGSVVCVQHRPEVHQRVEALRGAFRDQPRPLVVHLHLYAAGGGGAVRVAETLRAQAGPRESGRDLIVRRDLIEQAAKALDGLTGLLPLGTAEVGMDQESAFRLEFSRLTADDPLFTSIADPPALGVPDEDARYGLWLDVYAEDLAGGRREAGERAAFSVHAEVRRPIGSHIVPRTSGPEMPWTRLPVLAGHALEADPELPYFGTFVLLGLSNPFPPSRDAYPELVLLIGVRPQGTGLPDPPPGPGTAPRILPSDERTRDHDLGMALTLEMQDEVLTDDWPDRRSVGEPLPATKLREAREKHLAVLLTEMAGLRGRATEGRLPVVVHDTRATATLGPDEHQRLAAAVARLRTHENDLYRVDVLSAVVPRAQLQAWLDRPGVRAFDGGTWTLDAAAAAAVDRELRPRAGAELYGVQRQFLARATQLVSHARVTARTITRDLHVRVLGDGVQRYTPIPGLAEEGLLVEVRPDLDQDGRRFLYARARVARLRAIERRPYPKAAQPAAVYDVPVWFDGTHPGHSRRTAADIVDDSQALLLPLDLPGTPDQVVLVKVHAVKVQ